MFCNNPSCDFTFTNAREFTSLGKPLICSDLCKEMVKCKNLVQNADGNKKLIIFSKYL